MASDWHQMARKAASAANALTAPEHYRSCVSRCYYAAYSAVAGELLRRDPGMRFARDRRNPDHGDLPRYIRNNLTHLPPWRRSKLATQVRFLRQAREDADYRPAAMVDEARARDARRFAHAVLRELGIEP